MEDDSGAVTNQRETGEISLGLCMLDHSIKDEGHAIPLQV
jgi:hypothetical protein